MQLDAGALAVIRVFPTVMVVESTSRSWFGIFIERRPGCTASLFCGTAPLSRGSQDGSLFWKAWNAPTEGARPGHRHPHSGGSFSIREGAAEIRYSAVTSAVHFQAVSPYPSSAFKLAVIKNQLLNQCREYGILLHRGIFLFRCLIVLTFYKKGAFFVCFFQNITGESPRVKIHLNFKKN
ncbi:hypothetical protein [Domibacillus tundrae]|uniref:hypothetical protein n=1 Tax=Domibacillus tundrae TaxID=1587527 RepID=UPI003398F0C1